MISQFFINFVFPNLDCMAFQLFSDKEHKKHFEKQSNAALAYKSAVRSAGRGKGSDVPAKRKKNKERDLLLSGSRVLDLEVARGIASPGAYLYETTDGLRMHVFGRRRRRSTSSMISIGKPLSILHCLHWAWTVHNADGGAKNQYYVSKIIPS